jgi:hypothetical protein
LDWQNVGLSDTAPNPQVADLGGFLVSFSKYSTGTAIIAGFKMQNFNGLEYPTMGVTGTIEQADC